LFYVGVELVSHFKASGQFECGYEQNDGSDMRT